MLTTRLLLTEEMKAKQYVGVKILEDYGTDTTQDGNGRTFTGQNVLVESDQDTMDAWLNMCEVFIIGVDGDPTAYDVYTKN